MVSIGAPPERWVDSTTLPSIHLERNKPITLLPVETGEGPARKILHQTPIHWALVALFYFLPHWIFITAAMVIAGSESRPTLLVILFLGFNITQ
jgi:hypothetical protein